MFSEYVAIDIERSVRNDGSLKENTGLLDRWKSVKAPDL